MGSIARDGLSLMETTEGLWPGWTRDEVMGYMDHVEDAWARGSAPWDATAWLARRREDEANRDPVEIPA